MPEPSLESRLAQIEEKLKKPKKDCWDIFQLFASLLIPASIAFSGYWFSRSLNEAQLQSGREQAEKQQAIARINARVAQAQFVGSFINALLDENLLKRKLAINAVLIALPEEGPQFVEIVRESETNKDVRTFAQAALEKRQDDLVESLHSSNAQKSLNAADNLALGWHSNTNLPGKLLAAAARNTNNTNGVDNTFNVLNTMDPSALKPFEAKVKKFTVEKNNSSPQRQMQVQQLNSKF